jgi:hypothetical protein
MRGKERVFREKVANVIEGGGNVVTLELAVQLNEDVISTHTQSKDTLRNS